MSFAIPNSDGEILPSTGTERLSTDQIVAYSRDFIKVGDKITAVLGAQFRNRGLKLVTTITAVEKDDEGHTMVSYRNGDSVEEFEVHVSQLQWDLHQSKVEKIVQQI